MIKRQHYSEILRKEITNGRLSTTYTLQIQWAYQGI